MTGSIDRRITELEVQLAHLQRLFDQLNEVVTEQALENDRLKRRVAQLTVQFKELKSKQEPDTDPLQEKPPHY